MRSAGSGRSTPSFPVRKNVAAWRIYNHRHWELQKDILRVADRAPFVCECTSAECVSAVALTMLEFEAAHMCPTWCAVQPGHTMPGDGARILVRHSHFWIVELIAMPLYAPPAAPSAPPRSERGTPPVLEVAAQTSTEHASAARFSVPRRSHRRRR